MKKYNIEAYIFMLDTTVPESEIYHIPPPELQPIELPKKDKFFCLNCRRQYLPRKKGQKYCCKECKYEYRKRRAKR